MEWLRLEEIDDDPNFILGQLGDPQEEVSNKAGNSCCINEGSEKVACDGKVEWDWQDDHELVWPAPPWELETNQDNIIPSWSLWDTTDTDLLQNCTNNHEATTVENQNRTALVSWLLS